MKSSSKILLPWKLPEWIEGVDAAAIQAVAAGNANSGQQKLFWDFLQRFCGCGQMSFWPGGDDGRRATDFAEGRRWVGDQLRRIRNKPIPVDIHDEPPPMPADDPQD